MVREIGAAVMKSIAAYLRRGGYKRIRIEGQTVYYVLPSGTECSITRHRGGALTEKFEGRATAEHRSLQDLKRAWGQQAPEQGA